MSEEIKVNCMTSLKEKYKDESATICITLVEKYNLNSAQFKKPDSPHPFHALPAPPNSVQLHLLHKN